MKAIVIHEFGGPEVLRYEDVPDPVAGAGEVVVEVHAVSVNRVLHVVLRQGGQAHRGIALPLIPGVDPSRVVSAVGDGVTHVAPGDRVTILAYVVPTGSGPGFDAERNVSGQVEMLGIHRNGGDAELVKVAQHNVFPSPEGVSFAEATVISRHAPTAYNLLVNMARLEAGEWVLIMGASGNLGTLGIQIAKSRGATVIAAAGSAERVQVGLDLGADHGIDYRAQDLTEEVMRITDGSGVNVVYDNIADPENCPKAIAALAQRGRLVTAGAHAGPVVPVNFYTLYHNQLTIMGNPENRTEDLEPCLQEAAAGRLRVRIDRIMPLSQAQEAHRLIENEPGIGKIILDPTLG